jgi:YidC/Oxa1 family membrane protein insertase
MRILSIHPLVGAENSLFKLIGEIFHPLFLLMGWILAGIYSVIPNYGLAIAGLTIVIMLVLTPVTIKSNKSMIAMQRLQPEMKKLQAKYKGAENRETLNQEMMKLYKENGTSPFGACLPTFLQFPFLIVLYSLIRGLSNVVHGTTQPRYIDSGTRIYKDLVASHGHMHWFFGMDLSARPLAHHGTNQAVLIIPYLVLIALSIFLQYYQMRQMNGRNPQAAAANPQMQTMQKVFPLVFGLIYLNIAAGAAIYMLVSSAIRIATQDVMYRTGMLTPPAAEREIGPASKAKEHAKEKDVPPPPAPKRAKSTVTDGTSAAGGEQAPKKAGNAGSTAPNGRRPGAKRPTNTNGARSGAGDEDEPNAAPKAHPRSRSKRARKAR